MSDNTAEIEKMIHDGLSRIFEKGYTVEVMENGCPSQQDLVQNCRKIVELTA